MRETTGHPARAIRGSIVLLALWLGYRAPQVAAAFDAEVATADRGEADASPAAGHGRITPLDTIRASALLQPMPEKPLDRLRDQKFGIAMRAPVARQPGRPEDAVVIVAAASVEPTPDYSLPVFRDPSEPVGLSAATLAAQAYAALRVHDRRNAADLFTAALTAGEDPRSEAWQRQRNALTRRWSANAYSVVRARGDVDLAVTPVLGGGQSGAALAWSLDPLAHRPIALTARGAIAHDDGGRSAIAAIGVSWQSVPGVTVAVERLIPLGPVARGDWTVRVAGGAAGTRHSIDASAYGETGVVGSVVYAAVQAHAGISVQRSGIVFGPGIGAWTSLQHGGGRTVDRLDLGPGITARAGRFNLAADYRFRVTGNAAPGSGPVLTLSTAF